MLIAFASCKTEPKVTSIELIKSEEIQTAIFNCLMIVTENVIDSSIRKDSLAFLVLPLEASCPSCRKKALDSIIVHEKNLKMNHFIVLSANSNQRTMRGYFLDRHSDLPDMENRLFLDSTNQAGRMNLYEMKPTIYYTFNERAYKRVGAIPMTVKEDLREFFSGHRHSKHKK